MAEYLTTFAENILAMGWSDSHVRFNNSTPSAPATLKQDSLTEWEMS